MTIRTIAAVMAAMLATTAALPALADHKHEAASTVPQTADGQGVVKAIDAKTGTITLDHDPIPALKWPAMRMRFKVQSAAVLKGLTVGRKVRFILRNDHGKSVVTRIEPL